MPTSGALRARTLCFTLNNPVVTGVIVFDGLMGLRYGICSLEMSESGTPHLQGYLEFNKPVRIGHFKDTALKGAHFELRKGTRVQARDYCRKEDTHIDGPWEFGKWGVCGQGARNDLYEAVQAIKDGVCMDKVAEEFSMEYVKFSRGLEKLQARVAPEAKRDRTIDPTVIFIYGESGTGKSRLAAEIGGEDAHWQDSGKWWDGYSGQEWVVFDDFAGSSMPYKDFKRIVDRYPCTIETKGGTRQLTTTKFIITSTKLPIDWWNLEKVGINLTEIHRRITKTLVYDEFFKKFEEKNLLK